MSKKSVSNYDLISRIERAPNMSRVIDAYDAALGGSDVSAHRYRGQWQVWHGQGSGFCGDFVQVRAHLADRAEEILEHAAAEVEQAPAMVPQLVQQQQADASATLAKPDLEVAAKPEKIELDIGRCTVTRRGDEIRFYGHVMGGGRHGPGDVTAATGFKTTADIRFYEDARSGSKRSGTCVWKLEADRLYILSDVAESSSSSGIYYLSTYNGNLKEISERKYEAELRRLFPLQAEEYDAAQERRRVEDAARIERERVMAEERRVAREALAEKNAEEAARLKKEGQPKVAGLPKLTGTAKQIAYALSIRNAVLSRQPDLPALKRERTAKFWIENHRGALYR